MMQAKVVPPPAKVVPPPVKMATPQCLPVRQAAPSAVRPPPPPPAGLPAQDPLAVLRTDSPIAGPTVRAARPPPPPPASVPRATPTLARPAQGCLRGLLGKGLQPQ
eukprot:953331-Amphidinium_carterae.1